MRGIIFLVVLFIVHTPLKSHRSLNCLIIDHSFPGLTQNFVLNQATYLIDQGHNVTILSLGHRDFASYNPVPGADKPTFHPDIEKYSLMNNVYYGNLPPDKRNYDVILCEFGNLGKIFMYWRKSKKITGKFVTFFRGRDLNALPGNNRGFYRGLLRTGDYFFAVCNSFKSKLIRFGAPRSKIGVLHSTIDCAKFPYRKRCVGKDGRVKIISNCRLVRKKGLEYGIKAVARLCKKYPKLNLEYNIVGGGPLLSELERLIKDLEMEDKIHLLGWRSHEQIIELLDHSHIFLLPSVTGCDGDKEGIPNAIMEALACGLIVVSTKHSGIPEIIRHKLTGFLVRERDVNGLVAYLDYAIAHPELWERMGWLGRKYVEKYFDKYVVNKQLHYLLLRLAGE